MILVFVIKLNYITLLSLLFFRTRRLRTPSNKLIVNLTVADFMLLFMCHFVSLQNVLGPMLGIWFGAIGKIIYPKYDKNSNENCTIDVLEQIGPNADLSLSKKLCKSYQGERFGLLK